ncbi:CpaD family pilus assembly lipoprotein [Thalassobaculum sp.]|uniref:CpaD family pilus assembly lipoprotein n=1 Tax=Thalassobaculum sp. TaxID=2022740 RepID=UPI0032F06A76
MSVLHRLLPIALATGLTACSSTSGIFPSDAPEPVPDSTNVVSFSVRSDGLRFAPGTTELADADLDAFRARLTPDRLGRDHLVLVAPALPGDGLSEARADWTLTALRRQGVTATRAAALSSPAGRATDDGGVLLEIQETRVAAAVCDSYPRAHYARIGASQSTRPLGCITTANLGVMIADPADLRQGRPTGPADGQQQVQAVETYRTAGAKSEGTNPIAEAFAKAFGGKDQ